MANLKRFFSAAMLGLCLAGSGQALGQSDCDDLQLIRPFLRGDVGYARHGVSNMVQALQQAGFPHATRGLQSSNVIGLNAGLAVGERHKLGLGYDFSSMEGNRYHVSQHFTSLGPWYEFQVMKKYPLSLHAGLRIWEHVFYVRKQEETEAGGSLGEFFQGTANYSLTDFNAWNMGFELGVLYPLVETDGFRFTAQLLYMFNPLFDSDWEVVNNSGIEYPLEPNLPEDRLTSLMLKLSLDFDPVRAWKHKKKHHTAE